jgi:ribonucleoside-diphosphate reductase alpha chain
LAIKLGSKIKNVGIKNGETLKEKEKELTLSSGKLLKRPQKLIGSTYKLKPGNSEHALYLTINDIIVNGEQRPYEIFINTKNATSIQWVNVFTKLVSAIFRREAGNKTCRVAFIIEELLSTYDSSDYFFNGEFTKHPITMPSTVAYIGYQIRQHLIDLKLYELEQYDIPEDMEITDNQLSNAQPCPKCSQKTYVKQDCWICIECGYSQCG